MQVLIMFYLQTNLMNHFILFECTGVFLFAHNCMATILQFFKILIFFFFYVSLAPIIVMVPDDCCFYVYCVNFHFHKKKKKSAGILPEPQSHYRIKRLSPASETEVR